MPNRVLVSWVGRTDLNASTGDPDAGLGPIGQAVEVRSYTVIHLLSNFQPTEGKAFLRWLAPRTGAKIQLHQISHTMVNLIRAATIWLKKTSFPGSRLILPSL